MSSGPQTDAIVRDRIRQYLRRVALDDRTTRVVPLTGDASDRRYVRVLPPSGASVVLAVYADPFEYNSLPFVNVADLLRRMPVPVPEILGHECDLGILALEDLGDVTLHAHLGVAARDAHTALYQAAVDLICLLQQRGAELRSPHYQPYGVVFDQDKFAWELNFFVQHFLLGYRGATLAEPERAVLADEFTKLAGELAAEPRVLCHRDYHSRNLMVHAERLYVIDFQDARMGPDTYDLVSLLRDSYVDLPEATVDALIRHFAAARDIKEPAEEFRRRFDLVALQRNLKALGTFGYQTTVRRNPVYLQYIPRTLRHARENLHRQPRWGRLNEILAAQLEELR